ncbi:MAG: phosphatase PAP2 family protein [Gammaproteobacteria bacterium]|nr:phosphatase PAP2 family protein [Gammaproteobacteria bacterium]
MTEIFQQLLHWVQIHPLWSGIIIFLVAMTESLAIVGLIVPGVAIMFGIGALISAGAIEFWPAFAWAVAGAVAGDVSSFWLGFHFQDRISNMWPFTRYRESLEQGQAFFAKYGGKSVAFGRFFGPVRAVVPLIAGTVGMQPWRFAIASILSSLVWAPAYLAPGMVFGASLELASQVAFRLVTLIVLLAILIWLMIWLVRLTFRLCQPHASAWVQATLNWSRLHPAFTEIAAALADPNHPESRGLALLATILIFTVGLTALVFGTVINSTALMEVDQTVLSTLTSLHTPWADHLMLFSSRLADRPVIIALIVVVVLFLAWQRHWRSLMYWVAAVGFGLFASAALKYGLQIPRPPNQVPGLGPYSFPSGHTLRAVVLFGFLAVIIARSMRERWRWLPYGLAGLMIILVAISRLYLGVHWLSDILGSITLGMLWVAILGIAYYRHTQAEAHWLGLSLISILIITGATGVQTWNKHTLDIKKYLPQPAVTQIATTKWRDSGWSDLPKVRQDTRNRKNHPMNIQYAGELKQLEATLNTKGWYRADGLNWGNLLKLLSPDLPLQQLPLLPQVHDGRHESLALTKPLSDDSSMVLRLWPAFINTQPESQPLWIGNITELDRSEIAGMLAFPQTNTNFDPAFQQLLQDSSDLPQKQPKRKPALLLLWSGD